MPENHAPTLRHYLLQDFAYSYRVWITMIKLLSAPLRYLKIKPDIHQIEGPGVDGSKEPPGPRRGAGAKLSDTRMDSSPSRRYTPRIASLDKRVIRKRAPRRQRMNLLEESPRREARKGCDKARALNDQEIEGGRRHCRR